MLSNSHHSGVFISTRGKHDYSRPNSSGVVFSMMQCSFSPPNLEQFISNLQSENRDGRMNGSFSKVAMLWFAPRDAYRQRKRAD